MPVRAPRRRRASTPAVQMEAWAGTFDTGIDFFEDLEALGLKGNAEFDPAVREAAREAWGRLGSTFMASWQPSPDKPLPWAAERFGFPSEAPHA